MHWDYGMLGFNVILVLYLVIGLLAAADTISIARKIFPPRHSPWASLVAGMKGALRGNTSHFWCHAKMPNLLMSTSMARWTKPRSPQSIHL